MRCTKRKRVWSKRLHKKVLRCVKMSGRRKASSSRRAASTSRRRSGYRRGHRPFNKHKRCRAYGINRQGKRTCRSYGGRGTVTPVSRRLSSGSGASSWLPGFMSRRESEFGGLSGYSRGKRCVRFGRKNGRRVCRKYSR